MADSLIVEVGSGDERRALVALRTHLAETLLVAPPHAVAAIAARLQMVLARLATLEGSGVEVSTVDDLAAARVARRSGSADSASAGKRSQPRRSGGGNRAG